MATYSDIDDLILGELAKPDNEFCNKYIQDAADEIDSKLGFIYVTPIAISLTDPAVRAGALLIKRISIFLSSGRLVLANAASREEQYLNAYGASLVNDATKALDALASGTMPLPGATLLDSADKGTSGPIIANVDTQSNVESFYTFASDPSPSRFYPDPYTAGQIFPGRTL